MCGFRTKPFARLLINDKFDIGVLYEDKKVYWLAGIVSVDGDDVKHSVAFKARVER